MTIRGNPCKQQGMGRMPLRDRRKNRDMCKYCGVNLGQGELHMRTCECYKIFMGIISSLPDPNKGEFGI